MATKTKSSQTTAARTAFVQKYSKRTAAVLQLLAQQVPTATVARRLGLSTTTVATYKANMTRGVYSPWVSSNGGGRCNFRG